MYSTHAWKVDDISIWTIYCWKRLFIGFSKIVSFKIKVGIYEKFAKMLQWYCTFYLRRQQNCTYQQQTMKLLFLDRRCHNVILSLWA